MIRIHDRLVPIVVRTALIELEPQYYIIHRGVLMLKIATCIIVMGNHSPPQRRGGLWLINIRHMYAKTSLPQYLVLKPQELASIAISQNQLACSASDLKS